MIICHCKRVTSAQIAAASQEVHLPDGTVDLGALVARCHATEGCGGCLESVREVALRSASRVAALAV